MKRIAGLREFGTLRRSDVRSYNRRRELASCRTSARVSGGGYGAAILFEPQLSRLLILSRLSQLGGRSQCAESERLDFQLATPARLRAEARLELRPHRRECRLSPAAPPGKPDAAGRKGP